MKSLEMASHTKHSFHWRTKRNYIWCLFKFEEGETWQRINIFKYILRYLYFWMISFWFGLCLKQIRRRLWMWSLDGLHGRVVQQLVEAFGLTGCSELQRRHFTADPRIKAWLSGAFRGWSRARVHVLIVTELTLYVQCSPGCFAFKKY